MIDAVGPLAAPARPAAPARVGAGGFRIPAGASHTARQAGEAAATSGTSLLALQEDPPDRRRDHPARQGAEDLLRELSALHQALLAGDSGEPALDRAAALLDGLPAAHDPALAAIQRQVALRVRIEQARRGR